MRRFCSAIWGDFAGGGVKVAWPEVSSALGIDESLAEGYISRAMLLADFEWDAVPAEADFRKAIDLNPNNAGARHWYAMSLAKLGRFEEAREQIVAAQKQDPLSPIIRAARAKVHFVARQYRRGDHPMPGST